MGQTAPVPEFFGIYATTDGKLIPLTGGRGTFTPPQQNLNFFDWYNMNGQARKVLSLEGGDLRFIVFDAAVADASASIELYKLPFARNILPQQDALGQVGGLLGQISGQPQPKAAPVTMQKYVIAKTDALKIEFLQKPIPGQPQMIQLIPESPLEPGIYSIFAVRSQGGQQSIVTVPFEWNSASAGAAKPFCVDLAITGGYGGSMENHDAQMEHPYYLAKQKYVECGMSSSSTSSTFDTAPASGPVAQSAAAIPADCGQDFDLCMKNGNQALSSSNWDQAIAYYKKAAQVQPSNGNPWLGIGYYDLALGRFTEAKDDFDKGLKLGSAIALNVFYRKSFMSTPETGTLFLSPTEFRLSLDGKDVYSVPVKQVVASRVGGKPGSQYGSFSSIELVVNGKKMTFEFQAIGTNCSNGDSDNWVCTSDGNGAAQQQAVAQWLFDTINRLSQSSPSAGH
jgi:tetratricopeptide (TPR) repeat protein